MKTIKAISALLLMAVIPGCADGELRTADFNDSDAAERGPAPSVRQAEQALTTCIDIQRGLFGTVEDAYLSQNAPDYNGGSYVRLYSGLSSGQEKRSVLRFDLGSIPQGSTIDSATLTLAQIYKESGSTVNVHRVTAAWSEDTATWNNVGSAFDPAVMAAINAASGAGERVADLTALVQGWVSGAYANEGILLEEAPVLKTEFRSSEESVQATRPLLSVCYSEPNPGVMITALGEAYGHHGWCSGWNGCGDAATCALWACEINGYSNLVSYGENGPCTGFDNCHLFYSHDSIQWNWGNWCAVNGVSEIVCSN